MACASVQAMGLHHKNRADGSLLERGINNLRKKTEPTARFLVG
jgi:hypothetical protein